MTIEEKLKIALEALQEIYNINPCKNDFDAYCSELSQWGMCKEYDEDEGKYIECENPKKPNPKDFGL